ncbi:hypothetical protein [Acinetobacter indicus]|uniref:hypothetical protein n=1 Tax=Acinetobacter indicus TaxID=756892 RepID=UPI00131556ED|nr:hypothetical protein [Acinetobacter indicus]
MSGTEFPKMLYLGDKESYSYQIANNADEEQQLRKAGLKDYVDLPNHKTQKTIDYDSLTKDELQALITEQGKTFKSADTKAELITILES